MLIKLSAAVLAAVGAKSADEFPDALAKLLNDTKAAADASAQAVKDLQSSLNTATQAATELKTKLEAAEKTINDLTAKIGNPATLTEARIIEISKTEGSRAATEAVGAIGKGAPPAAPSSAAGNGAQSDVKALLAAGKFAEAFAADENAQAEFGKGEAGLKAYTAYMKNAHRVRISEKKGAN